MVALWTHGAVLQVAIQNYLTLLNYLTVLESQFPQKTVNFLFELVTVNSQLTNLWGS